MVSRGHSLPTLLNEYPISTLRDMMKGAAHNHRETMAVDTQGTATAVLHGMDCGFNKGKGKILQKFMKALFKRETKSKDMGGVEKTLFSLLGPRK